LSYEYYFSVKNVHALNATQSSIKLEDPKLKAEVYWKGLTVPTSMAFLGPDDILVLEKDIGKVK